MIISLVTLSTLVGHLRGYQKYFLNIFLRTFRTAKPAWMRLLREKCSLKRLVGELPNIRFFRSPSASNIENFHAVVSDELLKDQCRTFIARRPLCQVNPRFPVLLSKFRCAFAAASKSWSDGENYRGIRVSDIPLSPLKVTRRRSFYEVVWGADDAVFSLPSLWTPATMRESPANRDIQPSAVSACLASGNNFFNHGCSQSIPVSRSETVLPLKLFTALGLFSQQFQSRVISAGVFQANRLYLPNQTSHKCDEDWLECLMVKFPFRASCACKTSSTHLDF